MSVVPRAKLSHDLRFGMLAAVNVVNLTLQKVLTVVFAAMSFGPYSFVVPTPIAGFLTAAFLWWWVRPTWSIRPHLKRWRYLVGDSTRLLIAEFGRAVIDQSDYFLIGVFRTAVQVGIYTVGFLFSIQMLQILMLNLTNILFPAFTKLNHDPAKQFQGFLKAQRILAMFSVSGCLLQSAVAAPFAHMVFPGKWDASVIVMQILSLGMATRMVAGASFAATQVTGAVHNHTDQSLELRRHSSHFRFDGPSTWRRCR